jgi:hypothetical protein
MNLRLRPARDHRRRGIAALAVLFSVLFFAGCSFSCSIGGSKLTAEEQETQISAAYAEQTGTEVVSIECEEIPAEVDEAINCTATDADDANLTIEGKITSVNEDDDKVNFDWKVAAAEVPGSSYGEAAKQSLEQQTGSTIESIECPDRVAIKKGGDFRCTILLPNGEEFGATITMTNDQGGFEVEVDDEPGS